MALCLLVLAVTQSTGQKLNNKIAWSNYNFAYTENGFLLIREPLILKAKLQLWDLYFQPSPTNNLMLNIINDDMMKANKIVILEKKIVKRNRVIIIGSVSIATYIAIQVLISSLK